MQGEARFPALGRLTTAYLSPGGSRPDPILVLAAVLFAALALAVVVPAIPPATRTWLSEHLISQLLMALTAAAYLYHSHRSESRSQRRFRLLIGGAVIVWMASTVISSLATASSWSNPTFLLSDVANATFYLLLVLAAEIHPQWPSGWRRGAFEQRIERGGALVFLFGLVVYLIVIPANLHPEGYFSSWWPSFLLYGVLDVVLAARFTYLATSSQSAPWRTIYGLLALTAGIWIALDAAEGLMNAGLITYVDFGTPLDLLWNLPLLTLVLAGRLLDTPGLPVEPQPAKHVRRKELAFAGTSGLLVLYALAFPCLHILVDAARLVTEKTRLARELWVLVVLLALGTMAWIHHRYLAREARRLQAASERATARLLESQRLESTGRFARSIAHDFNNFLTAIGSYASLARRHDEAGPKLRQYLREIERTSDRAGDLVRQLLTFGRSRSGELKPLALNQVVARFLPTLRQLIEGTTITLSTRLDQALWTIRGERSQLEQVLLNLVVNARDAMPGGGEIEIATGNVRHASAEPETEGLQPMVLLRVTDGGEGIPAETLPLIFEPSYTTKKRGTGLGLATVYGIVRESGGEIEVESEPGRGTTFRIYFPVAVIGAEPARPRDRGANGRSVDSLSPTPPAGGVDDQPAAGASTPWRAR